MYKKFWLFSDIYVPRGDLFCSLHSNYAGNLLKKFD
jgi:hypothetical protein